MTDLGTVSQDGEEEVGDDFRIMYDFWVYCSDRVDVLDVSEDVREHDDTLSLPMRAVHSDAPDQTRAFFLFDERLDRAVGRRLGQPVPALKIDENVLIKKRTGESAEGSADETERSERLVALRRGVKWNR